MKQLKTARYLFLVVCAIMIGVVTPGCPKEETATPGENEVWIESSAFNPVNKLITQGTTVTWTNKDAATHTVTSGVPTKPSGTFDSGDLAQDATYSFKFDSTGTYSYYCKHHSGMTGSITVQ